MESMKWMLSRLPVCLVLLCVIGHAAYAAPSFAPPVPVNLLDTQGTGAGNAIAIADDTMVVGGQSGSNPVVFVYERINDVWVESARLSSPSVHAGNTALLMFSTSLAISPDGNTVYVGDPLAVCASNNTLTCGAIDVYQKPAAGWSDTNATVARLTPSVAASEEVGTALGISTDGSTLVAYGDAVYVFVKPSSGWVSATQTAVLGTASGSGNNGTALSGVSVDGGVVAVNTTAGSVQVYVEPGGGWLDTATPTAVLTDSGNFDSQLGDFGSGLKVAGNLILISAPALSLALVYQEPGGGWVSATSPTAVLQAPSGAAFFGDGINIVGSTAVVAAFGALYLYDEPNTGWSSEASTSSIPLSTVTGTVLLGHHIIYVTGSELATTSNNQCDEGVPEFCTAGFVLSSTAAGTDYDGLMILDASIDDLTTNGVRIKSGFTGDQLNFNFDVVNNEGPMTGTATFEATASGGTLTAVSVTRGSSCDLSGGKVSCKITGIPSQDAVIIITEQTNGTSTSAGVNASLSNISPMTWDALGEELTATLPLTIAPSVPASTSFTGKAGASIKGTLPVTYVGKNQLTFTIVEMPQGKLSVDKVSGAFTWTPPSTSFSGQAQFTYNVTDGVHTSADSTVTINESSSSGSGGGGVFSLYLLGLLSGVWLRRRVRGQVRSE